MAIYSSIIAICFCSILHPLHASSRRYTCPDEIANCSCSPSVVNCDLHEYTSFPENVTTDYAVSDLSLGQNNLTQINDDHLRFFLHIRSVNLRENQIATISENAFHNNRFLHTIELSRNRLSSLPVHLFKRLVLLENVYLGNNQLKVIESAHFGGLTSLKRVRLHDNQLTRVGSDAFIDSPGITELYLEFNKLQTPEKNWLLHFDHIETSGYELYMDNNPWSCDCRMKDFYDWAFSKKWFAHASNSNEQERVSIPKCHEPNSLRGLEMSTIDSIDKLICTGVQIKSHSKRFSVMEGHEITLECKATGFPTPIVSIVNPKGTIVSSNPGSVKYALDTPLASDSGRYYCNASGHAHSEQVVFVTSPIIVDVHKHPASVVSIVLLSLLASAVLLGIVVWYYKSYRPKAAYGRIPNDAKFEDGQIASYAKHNAESMKVSLSRPSGQSPYQTAITSHVSGGADDEYDDDVTEYHKDTEYLV